MVLISPLYLSSKKNLKKFSLVSCIGNSSGKILTIEVTNKIYLDEFIIRSILNKIIILKFYVFHFTITFDKT